eukprot:TRINITY_DN2135_c0_g1_i2.p1 TRINITY_DN2135_c0_g1~~TRINITY_DN2135_c0_g1_i2.p1  ORF type:complete len:551 (-),score=120.77 TRINITY_DN2135_c0_g1_i2:15-1610(-)
MFITRALIFAQLLLFVLGAPITISESSSSSGDNDNPGFKTIVSDKALNYFKDVALTVMLHRLKDVEVPDISGSADTKMGAMTYNLENIVITHLGMTSSTIDTIAGQGLTVRLVNVSGDVNMTWTYAQADWPHFKDQGTAVIHIKDSLIYIETQVLSSHGAPALSVTKSGVSITNLFLQLEGKASWLYNLFIDLFSTEIKSSIEIALAEALQESTNDGVNTVLASLPLQQTIGDNSDIVVDYRLVNNPQFFKDYATMEHKGEFYYVPNSREAPFVASPLPDTIPTKEMVQFVISDYMPNTAGYSFWKSGGLHVTVQDKDVPDDSPIRLNTTYFDQLIPPLPILYPNLMMELGVSASQTPVLFFQESGAQLQAATLLDIFVIFENGTLFKAATLDMMVFCIGSASVQTSDGVPTLQGQLQFLNLTFALEYTAIGPFDVTNAEQFVNFVISQVVLPQINGMLSANSGFPLPVPAGLHLVDPMVQFGPRFLVVSSDVVIDPVEAGLISESSEERDDNNLHPSTPKYPNKQIIKVL